MEDKELTFWEHLDVLRWALVRIIVVWFILAIGFFIAMPSLFDTVILGPCHNNFIFYQLLRSMGETLHLTGDFFTQQFDIKLQNINLAAPFFVHLSTSFVLSLVVLAPYILWEIWLFIRPALYVNESRGVKKALLLGSVMFYIGVAVGYFVIYPMTLRFLSTYNLSPDIEILISLNSYIDNFMTLVLCMGLAFELPLVTWILSLLGIITRDTLREYRRHAFVVIVIVAAIITPTGDPFTLMAVSLPLYALYELSILMVKEKKDDDDDDEKDKPSSGNGGGSNSPNGGASAQKVIEKKPDSPLDGGDAKSLPTTEDKPADAATSDKAELEKKEKSISEVLREQRAAAQRAKNEASNRALQERIDAAAKAAAAGTATGVAADANADSATPALTANAEPTVKESLAAAAETTAKKVKREPRMVIIDDQIFFEEYPDEDTPAPQDTPTEKQEAQPVEEPSTAKTTEQTEQPTPVEPTELAEPTEPIEPTEPAETIEPAKPVEPTEPTTSVEPTDPTKAEKPHIDFGGIKYDPNRFKQ